MNSPDETRTKQADCRDVDSLITATYLDFHPVSHRVEDYKSLLAYDRDTLVSRIHALFAQACKYSGLSYYCGDDPSLQEKKNLLLLLADACAVEEQIDAALALADRLADDDWSVGVFHPFPSVGFAGIRKDSLSSFGPSYTYRSACESGKIWECEIDQKDVSRLIEMGYPISYDSGNEYCALESSRLLKKTSVADEFPSLASRFAPGSLDFDRELVRLDSCRIFDIRRSHLSEELCFDAMSSGENSLGGIFMLGEIHPDFRTPKICKYAIEHHPSNTIRRLNRMVFQWVPETSKTEEVMQAYERRCQAFAGQSDA